MMIAHPTAFNRCQRLGFIVQFHAGKQARDQGVAVLLVSAELDEILSLSDRVAVMYKGQISAVLPIAEATRERVGLLMAGVTNTGVMETKEVAHVA